MVIFTERNDADRFHDALKMIEQGHREIEALSEKMRIQYGERGTRADRDGDGRYNERGDGYGERYSEHYGERRDAMGRYR